MSKRLSAERLAEIRAREQAATAGPWKAYDYETADNGWSVDRRIGTEWEHPQLHGPMPVVSQFVSIAPRKGDATPWRGVSIEAPNAEFIAHARQDIPDLLAEIERLHGLIKQAEWGGGINGWTNEPTCSWCGRDMQDGHAPTCPAFGSEA